MAVDMSGNMCGEDEKPIRLVFGAPLRRRFGGGMSTKPRSGLIDNFLTTMEL